MKTSPFDVPRLICGPSADGHAYTAKAEWADETVRRKTAASALDAVSDLCAAITNRPVPPYFDEDLEPLWTSVQAFDYVSARAMFCLLEFQRFAADAARERQLSADTLTALQEAYRWFPSLVSGVRDLGAAISQTAMQDHPLYDLARTKQFCGGAAVAYAAKVLCVPHFEPPPSERQHLGELQLPEEVGALNADNLDAWVAKQVGGWSRDWQRRARLSAKLWHDTQQRSQVVRKKLSDPDFIRRLERKLAAQPAPA